MQAETWAFALDLILWGMDGTTETKYRWLDAEGASLICTLRKAWGDDAPWSLGFLLEAIVVRGMKDGRDLPAAAESAALGTAHLLPALLRCDLHVHKKRPTKAASKPQLGLRVDSTEPIGTVIWATKL